MSLRDAMILRLAALWTLFIWSTRIVNIVGDDKEGFAFKFVHVTLALVSVLFALAIWTVASRNRRDDDASDRRRRREHNREERSEED